MTSSTINILLEVDDFNEIVFSIVSKTDLEAETLSGTRKLHSIRQKSDSQSDFSVKIFHKIDFFEEFQPKISKNEALLPFKSIEVEETVPQNIKSRSKSLKCSICKHPFSSQKQLNAHLSKNRCTSHENRKQVIKTLSYLPPNLNLPDLNNLPHHPYEATFLQSDNTIAYIHQTHVNNVLWITNFDLFGTKSCEICDETLTNHISLVKHRQNEHFFTGNKPNCNACGKICETPDDQRLHSLYCLQRELLLANFCYDCEIMFSDRHRYRSHLVQKHSILREKEDKIEEISFLYCAHCPYKTRIRACLLSHLMSTHFPAEEMNFVEQIDKNYESDVEMEEEYLLDEVEIEEILPKFVVEDTFSTKNEEKSEKNHLNLPLDHLVKITYVSTNPLDKVTYLDYLPPDLNLPDLTNVTYPIDLKVLQPNGTPTFIRQETKYSKIWVTNFDTHSKKCELCGVSVTNELKNYGIVLKHRMDHHFFPGNSQKCIGCSSEFASYEDRIRHTLYCDGKFSIDATFCYLCDAKFDDFLSVKEHLQAVHPKKRPEVAEKPWKSCQICKKTINLNVLSMREHVKNEHEVKLLRCAHCETRFSDKQFLENHLMQEHFPHLAVHGAEKKKFRLPEEPVKCKECDKSFSRQYIKAHMTRAHSKEKNIFTTNKAFNCELCGKFYLTSATFKNHLKTHLPDEKRPFKCSHCAKGFYSLATLVEHERQHTGEKPHRCPFCDKAFAKKQTYKDHVATHTGNGYKCHLCDRKLHDHSSLRKHLKRHEAKMGIKLTYTKDERRWKDYGLLEKIKEFI
ncbi:zinc finger protein Xfin-like [Culicoides brevitarsis]|uniref:zinc finger protein Xfin-like n=1 Tax=Culicoides brevitarsis TaxID=469753 RepID=UPI00307B58C3